MKKFYIVFISLIFLFSSLFSAAESKYIESNGIHWSYEYWQTSNNYLDIKNKKYSYGSFNSNIGITYRPTVIGKKAIIFRFPKNIANNIDDITFKNKKHLLIKDSDPLIGWNLNSNEDFEFEVPGNKKASS